MFVLSELITESVRNKIKDKFTNGIAHRNDLFFLNTITMRKVGVYNDVALENVENTFYKMNPYKVYMPAFKEYKYLKQELIDVASEIFNYFNVISTMIKDDVFLIDYKSDYYLSGTKIDADLNKFSVAVNDDRLSIDYAEDVELINNYIPTSQCIQIAFVPLDVDYLADLNKVLVDIKNTKYKLYNYGVFVDYLQSRLNSENPIKLKDAKLILDSNFEDYKVIVKENTEQFFRCYFIKVDENGNVNENTVLNTYNKLMIGSPELVNDKDLVVQPTDDNLEPSGNCTCDCPACVKCDYKNVDGGINSDGLEDLDGVEFGNGDDSEDSPLKPFLYQKLDDYLNTANVYYVDLVNLKKIIDSFNNVVGYEYNEDGNVVLKNTNSFDVAINVNNKFVKGEGENTSAILKEIMVVEGNGLIIKNDAAEGEVADLKLTYDEQYEENLESIFNTLTEQLINSSKVFAFDLEKYALRIIEMKYYTTEFDFGTISLTPIKQSMRKYALSEQNLLK